jgi:hypothetical protein
MNPTAPSKISPKILWISLAILIIIGGLGGGGYYFYSQYRNSQAEIDLLKNNPTEAANIETQKIVNLVGKLMVLPDNETPVDITVTDITKLKNQAFFTNAENGDRMLVYSQAKKAILYRPSINKVVEVFNNITLNNPTPTGSPLPTSAPVQNAPQVPSPISPLP